MSARFGLARGLGGLSVGRKGISFLFGFVEFGFRGLGASGFRIWAVIRTWG